MPATGLFPLRLDFARFLAPAFADCAQYNPSGSQMSPARARVVGVTASPDGLELDLRDDAGNGSVLHADQLLLATGNAAPSLPAALAPYVDHPAMIASPWQNARFDQIDRDAAVTVMGSSLTSVDVLASLMRRGHRGQITVFSRRGLRPREQRPPEPPPEPLPESWLLDRINGRVPGWLSSVLRKNPSVRAVLAATRERIRNGIAAGEAWQVGFDELRDVVWQIWPQLPTEQQLRFLRQLRPWYDVHRFRLSPATEALVTPAIERGQIRVVAARLERIEDATCNGQAALSVYLAGSTDLHSPIQTDVFINCAGLDILREPPADSLEAALLASGILSRHPTGLGFRVDGHHRVLDSQGLANQRIRLIGPATAGCFGDPLGAMFISVQINRLLPALFYSAVAGEAH